MISLRKKPVTTRERSTWLRGELYHLDREAGYFVWKNSKEEVVATHRNKLMAVVHFGEFHSPHAKDQGGCK